MCSRPAGQGRSGCKLGGVRTRGEGLGAPRARPGRTWNVGRSLGVCDYMHGFSPSLVASCTAPPPPRPHAPCATHCAPAATALPPRPAASARCSCGSPGAPPAPAPAGSRAQHTGREELRVGGGGGGRGERRGSSLERRVWQHCDVPGAVACVDMDPAPCRTSWCKRFVHLTQTDRLRINHACTQAAACHWSTQHALPVAGIRPHPKHTHHARMRNCCRAAPPSAAALTSTDDGGGGGGRGE